MRYRERLPQLDGGLFLTDGGMETSLIFHEGLQLPQFAAFDLLKNDEGVQALRRYFWPYLELARERGTGFVLESPTWRASRRWATKLGYDEVALDLVNRRAIELMEDLRQQTGADAGPMVISGCVGPHDDGYQPATKLEAEEAQAYHATQIETFADTAADMVTATTMTYADEAIGVARAARAAGLPSVISFTVETDGRLPDGQSLGDAITAVDDATDRAPAYFMINCAHPTHFETVVARGGDWCDRVMGLRANASTKSHAELDESETLDEGDPADLGLRYASLRTHLRGLTVLGGCCGTDHRHVAAVCRAWNVV